MDETAQVIYTSELRTEATHVRSGVTIITDAPPDNQGKGEAFSPTDLLATSLASCMMTIMGIAARNHGFSIDGTKARMQKIMASDPRRVGEIHIELDLPPNDYTDRQKKIIEKIAFTCPVYLSLHPDLKKDIVLNF